MVVRKLCNLAVPGKVFAPVTRNRPIRGVVVRTASKKTTMVKVNHRMVQRIYGNYMTHSTLYMCHDEHELCNIGDEVLVQKSRPYSKRKHWRIHSWVRREPSALWFKIHPEYALDDADKERLSQKVNFDYKLQQEAFEFSPKEIFEIQEGVRDKSALPERIRRFTHDHLVNATLVNRSVAKLPMEKLEEAKESLAAVIDKEKRYRERFGLPHKWALDDEPGTVTVARMQVRIAQNELEAYQAELDDIARREKETISRITKQPESPQAFPSLTSLLKVLPRY
jgi:small subunit ribosomal protein S17